MPLIKPKDLSEYKNVKILIVDDEEVVLEVMKSFIASFGFQFATACNGVEAIEKLKDETFEIIVTDLNMPQMDGMELLEYVTDHHPKTGVIVVTGISEEYSYIDVINAGAIDYMTKPFDGNELIAKLLRVLREQTMVHKLEQMSIRDSLTNLYNRRHFDHKINDELHRAVRQSYPIFF